MKIKVVYHNPLCKIAAFGDWFDLKNSSHVVINGPKYDSKTKDITFNHTLIDLGVSMQLPKFFEANIVPRSSTFRNFGLIQANHFGVVDSEYCGDNDVWCFSAIALRTMEIEKGSRLCQFRIRPNQNAPIWVKLKWLFTSKIEFVEVASLGNKDRGGFGSTKF